MVYTTKYSKNQPKPAKKVRKFADGGLVDDEYERGSKKNQQDANDENDRHGLPSAGLPVVVRTNGKSDPGATGRLSAKNFIEGLKQSIPIKGDPSAKSRAKKDD